MLRRLLYFLAGDRAKPVPTATPFPYNEEWGAGGKEMESLEAHDHPENITTKQALAGALAVMGTIGAVALAAGMALSRLGGVEAQVSEMNLRAQRWEAQQQQVELKINTLQNDIAWQTGMLQLIADKMQVAAPIPAGRDARAANR